MRGFSIAGLVFSYVGAMILGHGILLLFMQFMSGVAIFSILYFMQTTVIMHLFVIRFIMFMIAALILYFMQLTYFLSMHILEYKQNIWQSCKEVYQMISDKFLFLSKILFLQILISISVLSFFYIGLSRVVTFFAGVIAWPFNLFAIDLSLIFIYMVHNFFYAWAYLLLYAWVCLVWAHVYRQLNCPPTENPSCASCKSCEI